MGTRVQFYTRLWNARIRYGSGGTLPTRFDATIEGKWGLTPREVEPGRTTGTAAAYRSKQAKYGGNIPYYTLDRYELFVHPNTPQYFQLGRAGGTLPKRSTLDSRPVGALAFVVMMDGEFRIAKPMGIGGGGRLNHAHIADMAPQVLYAGTISFGNRSSTGGILNWWNNDSGAYRCNQALKALAGLPIERYDNPRWPDEAGVPPDVQPYSTNFQ